MAERSESGEGREPRPSQSPALTALALSVTYGDSSPRGRAKALSVTCGDSSPRGRAKTLSVPYGDSSPKGRAKALSVTFGDSSPKGRAKGRTKGILPLPWGEVAERSEDGEGEDGASVPQAERFFTI